MAANHGTRRRCNEGCRCEACAAANNAYQQEYRQRRVSPPVTPPVSDAGPVESGVMAEIDGLAAQARPGLAQVALAVARVLDNPRAVNQHAAAKVLSVLLDKLRSVSARGRRGGLAVVRTMTEKGGA
jgi:hypothetical protein